MTTFSDDFIRLEFDGGGMTEYNIDKIHYRDIYGDLLWEEPMIHERLHAVGEKFIYFSIEYIVRRVAVADNIQHVNVEKFNGVGIGDVSETDKYIENLESALVDVLDGNSSWWDIQPNTGLSEERCKEIESFFQKTVMVKHMNKHS